MIDNELNNLLMTIAERLSKVEQKVDDIRTVINIYRSGIFVIIGSLLIVAVNLFIYFKLS